MENVSIETSAMTYANHVYLVARVTPMYLSINFTTKNAMSFIYLTVMYICASITMLETACLQHTAYIVPYLLHLTSDTERVIITS